MRLEYGIATGDEASVLLPPPGSGRNRSRYPAPVSGWREQRPTASRISATNAGGTSKGNEQAFQTLSSRRW